MKIFIIEAYGGKESTDGPIANFTVQAPSVDEAVELVRHSRHGQRFERFEVMEETGEFDVDEPGIIAEGKGSHAPEH